MPKPLSFLQSYLKRLPLALVVMVAVFGMALFVFAFISHEIFQEQEKQLDESVFHFLSARITNPDLTRVMKTITFFASGSFLKVGYAVLIVLSIVLRKWKRSLEIAAIGLGGYMVNYLMKLSFHRTRPPDPLIGPLHNFSFPSGHASSGMLYYGLLCYLVWKTSLPRLLKQWVVVLLLCFVLLIGFSRIYLRVHYFTDVIAGFSVGIAFLVIMIWVMDQLKHQSANEAKRT